MRLERDKEVLGRAPSPSFLHVGVLHYRICRATWGTYIGLAGGSQHALSIKLLLAHTWTGLTVMGLNGSL